jgi:hypothetical protein
MKYPHSIKELENALRKAKDNVQAAREVLQHCKKGKSYSTQIEIMAKDVIKYSLEQQTEYEQALIKLGK